MLSQLAIAVIPFGLYGDWTIPTISAIGIGLALATGLLPQWNEEKWSYWTHSNDTYVLTRGNGSQNAIAILANGHGLNLEDLAAGQNNMDTSTNISTRATILGLSISWILLLITAAGLTENTWFLLAVGGCARRPENFGISLEYVDVIGSTKVMDTLLTVERKHPCLGRSMIGEFFPGKLRDNDVKLWGEFE